MDDDGDRGTSEGPVGTALARVGPDSIDGQLIRRRLMAEMFGRDLPAPRFGRFELQERIGHGGMGVVYRAWDPQLERLVAIKVVDTASVGDALRERALREARGLAKLAHPNVVTVYEAGLAERWVWIAMELVEGTTLHEWLAREPRPDATQILAHWTAVGRGLLAAHEVGLVHRDVKPSNVLVGNDGRARLIDFGLVRGEDGDGTAGEALADGDVEGPGTTTGSDAAATRRRFVGTYHYAAPEQRRGEVVEAAADQYALCASIWESLTGQRPPEGADALPPSLRGVLQRGLHEDPRDRFASLSPLLSALDEALAPPPRGRTRGLVLTGLLMLAASVGAVQLFGTTTDPAEPCPRDATALAGTWDEARRDALRSRLVAAEQPFSTTTFTTLAEGIDEWAASWQDAQQAACRAVRVDGTDTEAMLARRRQCLERQRRSVQITLGSWSNAAPSLQLPAHAPALLGRLPSPHDCDDATQPGEPEPLPTDAAARDAVLSAHDRLDEARALAAAGATERARAIVDELTASGGAAMTYTPLRLEAQALPAQLDVDGDRISRAVPRLLELAREADARQLDSLSARLRVEAAVAAAGRWSGGTAERILVDEAQTALRRLARPREPLEASLRHATAVLAQQDGRLEEALAGFREALALASSRGDEALAERERWFVAATMGQLGRYDDARATLEQGRDAAEHRWGRGAPLVGSFEFDLAVLALETGRLPDAERHLDIAEAIDRAAWGPDSFAVARGRFARAKLRMAEGDLASALALVEQALPAYLHERGPDHEAVAELHEALGVLRFFDGDLLGSIESYRAASAIVLASQGPDHPDLARLHSNLGESLAALGRLDEAEASFARSLEVYARSLPADHPELALPLKGRGQVALASGQPARAVEDLERALALHLRTGAEPLELADVRLSLARALALAEGGRSARTIALAEQARDDFTRLQQPDRAQDADDWLAGRSEPEHPP